MTVNTYQRNNFILSFSTNLPIATFSIDTTINANTLRGSQMTTYYVLYVRAKLFISKLVNV